MKRRFFLGSLSGVVAGLFGTRAAKAQEKLTADVHPFPWADPLGAKEYLPLRYPGGRPNRVMRIFRLQLDGTAVEIPRQEVRAGDRVICVMARDGRLTRCSAFTAASDWHPGDNPNLTGGEVNGDPNFEAWNLLTQPGRLPGGA